MILELLRVIGRLLRLHDHYHRLWLLHHLYGLSIWQLLTCLGLADVRGASHDSTTLVHEDWLLGLHHCICRLSVCSWLLEHGRLLGNHVVWPCLALISLHLVSRNQYCSIRLHILIDSLDCLHLCLLVDRLLSCWLLHISHWLHAHVWLWLHRSKLSRRNLHEQLLLRRNCLKARKLIYLWVIEALG